jgi:hypothetical protein
MRIARNRNLQNQLLEENETPFVSLHGSAMFLVKFVDIQFLLRRANAKTIQVDCMCLRDMAPPV